MGGLDVIMVSDFYQAPPIRDSWIFKSKIMNLIFLKFNGMKTLNVINLDKLCAKKLILNSLTS